MCTPQQSIQAPQCFFGLLLRNEFIAVLYNHFEAGQFTRSPQKNEIEKSLMIPCTEKLRKSLGIFACLQYSLLVFQRVMKPFQALSRLPRWLKKTEKRRTAKFFVKTLLEGNSQGPPGEP